MHKNYTNIVIQLIVGFFVADFISGFGHWFEDTYLDYCNDWPIISEIAKHNEMHHFLPRSILAFSFLDNILTIAILTIPATILLCILTYYKVTFVREYAYFFMSLIIFSTISNYIHKLSHLRDCEKNCIIHVIQKMGLFCSHEHHKLHHENAKEKYCVITEYNNYILDKINFWRCLEYVIYICTSIKPKRKMAYSDYAEIQTYLHENAKLECPDTPTKTEVENLFVILDKYKKCNTSF